MKIKIFEITSGEWKTILDHDNIRISIEGKDFDLRDDTGGLARIDIRKINSMFTDAITIRPQSGNVISID